ncbi:MAG TPA: membrane or secreted protein [Cyclobacteriaceae bacterium]
MKLLTGLLLSLALLCASFDSHPSKIQKKNNLIGAWQSSKDGNTGLWIITEKHFSITYYTPSGFGYTEGGEWGQLPDGKIEMMWEYHTKDIELVGEKKSYIIAAKGDQLSLEGTEWKRIDNGSPGQLAGAWLITGRYRDGELSERTPGVRRTMKILSGTKFQWIAYNVETKEFFGTGGGSYTTKEGKYTEHIEFFSRDNSRVGASLEFEFKLENGKWRHSGRSSKGDSLDEVWTKREVLGI